MKIKTIDINVKEWFDKVNGNSYFAGAVTLNYGMKKGLIIHLHFQYGYGDHYIDVANQTLQKAGLIPLMRYDNGCYKALWQYCDEKKIILRAYKQENCKKRELMIY